VANRFWVGGTGNWDGVSTTHWSATDGGPSGASVPTSSDDVFFNGNSGGGTVTITATANTKSINTTNFGGTVTGSSAINIALSMNLTGGTWSATGAITFNGTTTGALITLNGKTIANAVTFNGVGGGWTLADAFLSSSTVTLTNGSFSTGAFSFQSTTVSVTGSAARTWDMTNSQVTLTGTGNVWNATTVTLLTLTVTGSTIIVNNASASSKTFIGGTKTYAALTFSGSGSGAYSITGTNVFTTLTCSNTGGAGFSIAATTVTDINFTGYTGTWSGTGTLAVKGNVTLGNGMTASATGAWTLSGSAGTQTITSNSVAIAATVTVNTTGSTVSFADGFSSSTSFTLTAGTAQTNGNSFQVTTVSITGSTTRAFNITNSLVTLTGTGTVWNATTVTALTLTATGSTITVNNASATGKTFVGGGLTYGTVVYTGAGSGTFTYSGNNTYTALNVTNTGGATVTGTGTQTTQSLTFTSFNGTWAGTATWSITASGLTYVAGMTASATGTITFTDTSGITRLLTSNGVHPSCAHVFDGVGGVWHLGDAFASTKLIQLNNGTFSSQGFNLQAGSIRSSNTNTRTLDLAGSAVMLVAGIGGANLVWTTSVTTGLTLNLTGTTITVDSTGLGASAFQGLLLSSPTVVPHLVFQGTGGGGFAFGAANVVDAGAIFTRIDVNQPDVILFPQTSGGNQILQYRIPFGRRTVLGLASSNDTGRTTLFKRYKQPGYYGQAA